MVKFMSLSSGSCGNCYYLATEKGGLLIDAGVGSVKLRKIFQEYNLDLKSFSAVLVTFYSIDRPRLCFFKFFSKRY